MLFFWDSTLCFDSNCLMARQAFFFFYYLTVYLNAHQTLAMSATASLILVEQKCVCKRRDRKCMEERHNESKSWRGMFPDLRPVMAVTAVWEVIIAVERHSPQGRGVSESFMKIYIYIKQQNFYLPCWNSHTISQLLFNKCSRNGYVMLLKKKIKYACMRLKWSCTMQVGWFIHSFHEMYRNTYLEGKTRLSSFLLGLWWVII